MDWKKIEDAVDRKRLEMQHLALASVTHGEMLAALQEYHRQTQSPDGELHEFCCRRMAFGFADGKIKRDVHGVHMVSAHMVLPADRGSQPTYAVDRCDIDFCPFCSSPLAKR